MIADSVIDSGSIDGTCYALSLGSNAPMMVKLNNGSVECKKMAF